MSSTQTLRPATPHDDAFLRLLFSVTNSTLASLPGPLRAQLADMQYRGRQLTYATNFPATQDLILCLPDNTPAGRLLFATTPTGLHLIDIAVLPEYQGHGLAAFAIAHLQQLAGDQAVTLQLTPGNPAERLYRRLGFQLTAQDETSLHMRWQPSPATAPLDTPYTMEAESKRLPHGSIAAKSGPENNSRYTSNPLLLKTLRKNMGGGGVAATLILLFSFASIAHAQGILTVTPGRVTSTAAGTGTVGYTGDNGTATSATLAAPAAVAYDAAGNLYVADANNHVIREVVKATGTIVTVAGTGVAGYGGDGAAATAAFLDTPTGLAVDTSNNIFIADSHNNRIRKITAGTITTIAGTGTKGFSGDNAVATAATLNLPSSVAVDTAGNVYIADTNNQRIRKITAGTITTIAGTGEQSYTGDNAAATAATLDSPTGVAVDTAGNVYIADRHNQRIREVSGGIITTLAGSGTPTFAGGFSGDGAASTSSSLAKPTGVSADAAGNVYIADTNNQRVRQLGGGVIATIAGNGQQGFGADGGPSTAAVLNAPKTVAPDAQGNLALADTLDQRVRSGTLPTLALTSQAVGLAGTAQPITLSNTGSAAITVSTITPSTGFAAVAGGTCTATPITLGPGASCTQNIAAKPTAVGAYTGSVVFSGTGVINQTVLLTGNGTVGSSTTTITSSIAQPIVNQSITFTAQVLPIGVGTPTGTVQFYANGVAIGAPIQVSASGLEALTTSLNVAGSYAITAVYSGDTTFSGSTSATLTQTVADFSFALSSSNPGGASQTVPPGQTATYSFTVTPLSVPFPYPITLSATGLPPSATVTFTPQTLTLGSSPANFTMAVKTAAQTALHRKELFTGGTLTFAFLLLPFGWKLRRQARRFRPMLLGFAMLMSLTMLGITGCGTGPGFFGQLPQSYTITVTGTATASNGAILQRSTTVQLTVE